MKNADKTKILLFFGLCLVAVSYFFILSFFRYDDTVSLTAWCVTFWDSLFSGNLGEFFTYQLNNYRGAFHSAYHVAYITYFPWIIWNFPLWLTHPLSNSPDVTGMKCIIWSKLFLALCLVILCIYVYKIMMYITESDFVFSLGAVLLVAGSLEMLDSVAYAGQDEIVYLSAFVIALHQFIKGKRVSGFVFSVLAVTLCPLMIIPTMTIYVLLEKRLLRLLLGAIICVIPTLLFGLAYRNDAAYQLGKSSLNTIGTFQIIMNKGTIDTTIGPAPIAVVLLVILLFVAYMSDASEDDIPKVLIYYVAISLFALCFLTYSIWYRYCLYVPFFVLMIGLSKDNRNIKVFLLELIFVFRFIAALSNFYNFSYSFLSNIGRQFLGDKQGTMVDSTSLIFDSTFYVIRTVVLAAALIMFTICNKRFDKKVKFSIPWKAVVGFVPFVGLALCIVVIVL